MTERISHLNQRKTRESMVARKTPTVPTAAAVLTDDDDDDDKNLARNIDQI